MQNKAITESKKKHPAITSFAVIKTDVSSEIEQPKNIVLDRARDEARKKIDGGGFYD